MAVVGNQTSLRKRDLVTQKSPSVAYNALVFQHKAVAGDTGINLSLLSTPSEASTNGFTQPSTARLAGAELKRNPNVLKLISSIGGLLQPYVAYVVSGNLQIRFIGFTALEGEIFTGYIDPVAVNGANIIDVSAVPKTGVLAAGQTDINIGEQFKVNLHSSQQVGQYALEIDGLGQFRNTGNSGVTLDANYYEVDNGDGTGTMFRVNTARTSDVSYKLTPIGSVLERPAGSVMQVIEQQQGVMDKLVDVVASISGLAKDQITAAPTYPDLKAFGDRVLNMEANRARIDTGNVWTAAQALIGRTNGSLVGAGEIGEYRQGTSTSGNFTTTNIIQNIDSIVLQPGDYDVWAQVHARSGASGNANQVEFAIGTVNAAGLAGGANLTTLSAFGSGAYTSADLASTSAPTFWMSFFMQRTISISATSTVYLAGYSLWTLGTPSWAGRLHVRRMS